MENFQKNGNFSKNRNFQKKKKERAEKTNPERKKGGPKTQKKTRGGDQRKNVPEKIPRKKTTNRTEPYTHKHRN